MALLASSIICLKSEFNGKYMQFQQDRNANKHSLLQFTESNVYDPYIQFEVVKAKKGDDVFHLKCRYNNKFLVRWVPDTYWLSASSNFPNEDENSWNCTLFKPILVEDGETRKIRLKHVQTGYNLVIWTAPGFDSYLTVGSTDKDDPNKRDLFSVFETLFKLPKRVAFKGDNNKYLGANIGHTDDPSNVTKSSLQFAFSDPKDPKVEHEITQSSNGIFYIKNTFTGKFWSVINELGLRDKIDAIADDPRLTKDASGMFRLNMIAIDSCAFLNVGTKAYCKRNHSPGGFEYYTPSVQKYDQFSKLQFVNLDKLK